MIARYSVTIKKEAVKSIARLNIRTRQRVGEILRALATNPKPFGAIPLSGYANVWRIRLGDIRIIYQIKDDLLEIDVVRVAPRGQAYKDL